MLILTIAENLHELLENSSLTTTASLGKLSRVMEVAEHMSFVFIVAVFGSKRGWANRAGEMLNMILVIECCNI
jgi:hypothetical protein